MPKSRSKSHTYKDIINLEEKNEAKTQKMFAKELELYSEGIDIIYQLYECMHNEYSSNVSRDDVITMYFFIDPIVTSNIICIKNLVNRGYYYSSNLLVRPTIEALGLLMYCKNNPGSLEKYEDGKLKVSSNVLFSLTTKDINKKNKDDFWVKLNNYIHTNYIAILENVKVKETPILSIKIAPEFSKNQVMDSAGYIMPCLVVSLYYEILVDYIPNEIKNKIIDYVARVKLSFQHLEKKKRR